MILHTKKEVKMVNKDEYIKTKIPARGGKSENYWFSLSPVDSGKLLEGSDGDGDNEHGKVGAGELYFKRMANRHLICQNNGFLDIFEFIINFGGTTELFEILY